MQTLLMVGIGIVVTCIFLFIIFTLTGTTQKRLEKKLTKYGNIVARARSNIINNNEELFREIANKTANINKDAIKTIMHSVKDGLSDDNTIFCKHCGTEIDEDSTFCKKCGKKI